MKHGRIYAIMGGSCGAYGTVIPSAGWVYGCGQQLQRKRPPPDKETATLYISTAAAFLKMWIFSKYPERY